MTTPQLPHSRRGEAGFILPVVLIIVVIGAMVVIGLLGYASGLLRAGAEGADALAELYAADAGIEKMKERLGSTDYMTPKPFVVGRVEVTVHVTPITTPHTAVPTTAPQAFDPVLPTPLDDPVPTTFESVPEGTQFNIRWQYTLPSPTPTLTPTPTPLAITPPPSTLTPTPSPTFTLTPVSPFIAMYRGAQAGTPVATSEPADKENRAELTEMSLGEGTYRVEFDPGTTTVLTSETFSTVDENCQDEGRSYFCVFAYEDYIVISTAGQTTVTAYLRRVARWDKSDDPAVYSHSWDVHTLSWKPYPPDE